MPPEVCTFGPNIWAQTLGVAELSPFAFLIGRCVLDGEHQFEGLNSKGMIRTVNIVRSGFLDQAY